LEKPVANCPSGSVMTYIVHVSGERPVLANMYIRCTLCVHRFSPQKYPSKALILPKFHMYYGQPFSNKMLKFKIFIIPIA
jgi:hypothetical protein